MLDFRDLVDGTIKKNMVLFQKQNGLSQCLAAGRTERIVKLRKDLLGSVPFDGLWLETRVGGFSYVYIIIYIYIIFTCI